VSGVYSSTRVPSRLLHRRLGSAPRASESFVARNCHVSEHEYIGRARCSADSVDDVDVVRPLLLPQPAATSSTSCDRDRAARPPPRSAQLVRVALRGHWGSPNTAEMLPKTQVEAARIGASLDRLPACPAPAAPPLLLLFWVGSCPTSGRELWDFALNHLRAAQAHVAPQIRRIRPKETHRALA